ncbi:MAG: NAD(+)/NADH kinase [Burkholderiales bacterium]|nr:NAD(+)/NADH kinase [Burkholderiales bacterium]
MPRRASPARTGHRDRRAPTDAPEAAPFELTELAQEPWREGTRMHAPLPPGPVAIAARRSTRDRDGDLSEAVALVADVLARYGYTPVLEERTAQEVGQTLWESCPAEALGEHCRLVVAIGGDGTFITFARSVARHDVPIVGVNRGRLGFLTDLRLEQVEVVLPPLLRGEYREERRTLLAARNEASEELLLAVNDIVVGRSGHGSLCDLEVTLNDRFAFGLRADGLIVATPTGSTAYSLSAGGAIIAPGVNAFALVPIAPHALTNRPIVLSDETRIRIRVAHARDACARFDGHPLLALAEGEAIEITKASATARIWHPLDYDYFHTLREKLAWTETPETLAR